MTDTRSQVFGLFEWAQHRFHDASLGERATRGFAEILEAHSLWGTFYINARDLVDHSPLYSNLQDSGHEVAIHVDPSDLGYQEFLGLYGPEEQEKVIGEATDRYAQAMGYRPQSICIGYYSANDYTFPVIANAGYTQGSLSLPTRILPECASVWAGAPLDIHYTHAHNRLLPGSLDLVNIPPTVDPDSRLWGGKQPQDLRIELVDAKNHWYTINKAVDRMVASDVPVKYISATTHNTFDYSDPYDFRRETLMKVIEHIQNICTTKGYHFVGTTQKQLGEIFRRCCPLLEAESIALQQDTGQTY